MGSMTIDNHDGSARRLAQIKNPRRTKVTAIYTPDSKPRPDKQPKIVGEFRCRWASYDISAA